MNQISKSTAFRLKVQVPKEDYEQICLATYLAKNNILFYHVPNGGARYMSEAVKFKRMGVKKGVPDIVIPIARKGHHGLYIELKRVNGRPSDLSDEQKEWLTRLEQEGYCAMVAFGFDQARLIVDNYLKC